MPSRAELPTSAQLLRSTIIAIAAAAAILVTVVLPAEYGIDPIGIGRVLGLAELGEIKKQLAEEAERDRVDLVDEAPAAVVTTHRDVEPSLLDRLVSEFLIGSAAAQTQAAARSERGRC